MYNEKTNELEKRLVEVFGSNASLAITTARLGKKGYLVRMESHGMPFIIDARGSEVEAAEQLAIEEFEKQMENALKNDLFPTQKKENYKNIELTTEELEKLYKYLKIPDEEYLAEIKKTTSAEICLLDDGRYECVISSPYMNLSARSTGRSKKLAVATTIWTAHSILNPEFIKVGDWSLR